MKAPAHPSNKFVRQCTGAPDQIIDAFVEFFLFIGQIANSAVKFL